MEAECSNRREYVDEHHRSHLAPILRRSLARRFISLYSPETPLNRYLEYIRGFIPYPESPRSSAGHSTDLVTTTLSYVRAIYPVSTCASLAQKAKWRERSVQARQKAHAGERTDGRTNGSLPLLLCFIVSLWAAINSRGFTVPWKSAKHPPANIIHGTRPLFRRVTFPRLWLYRQRENSAAAIESRKSPPIAAVT